MPHHKATAYSAPTSTLSGSITSLPESSDLAISLGSPTDQPIGSSQGSGSTLIVSLASSQSAALDLQTLNPSSTVLGFSTTPNLLSTAQQLGQGEVQSEAFAGSLLSATASVNANTAFTLANSSLASATATVPP
ncbi:MAG: hypothetical protein WCD18_18035, partial [Thermosynechococcaceae cyanobacterium]